MKFTPKKVKLKNNKEVLVRSATVSDAENIMNTIKTYISDSEYIPKMFEEFKMTLEQEINWIHSFTISENSLLLVAEYEGEIIGNIDINGNPRIIMYHTGMIGMGMLQEWRNAGLGTALMESAISWAKENPVLELLWLQVYTENQLGLYLYKKMGFEEIGIMKNFFKQNHKYYDSLTMSTSVK